MLASRSKRRIRSNVSKSKAGVCKGLVIGGQVAGFTSDIASDISSIPLLGPIASAVTAGFSMVSHIVKSGIDIANTATDCSDMPFDEIKEILDKNFNEVKRKLDANYAVLIEVSIIATQTLKTVEKIRTEMNVGFARILETIKNSKIENVVTKINNFVQFFVDENERISGLPQEDYVITLEQGDFLNFLSDSRTAKSGSLRTSLFEIIDNSYAIPDSADDVMALEALYALYYGTQTFVSVMFFLIKTYSYLADFYYEKGRLEQFNEHFKTMRMTFQDFRHSLVGRGSKIALIHNILQLLETVKSKSFFRDKQLISQRIKTLTKIKKEIESMVLPVILDTPKNTIKASFKAPDITTPLGDWKAGSKVSYAIQFRNGRAYSKVSEFTHPFEVQEKACPYLKLPVDPKKRTRLIFRKFDNDKSQLIGVIDPYQTEFRDVDRDLYNSAGSIHEQTAMNEMRILIQAGANITATFEKGQQAIHAASRQGNVNIAEQFVLNNDKININARDKSGYTSLHVAAESGQDEFVKKLLEKNALVNVSTKNTKLTPLHLAARNGFKETVNILIQSPLININQKDAAGYTPMHSSVMGGYSIINIFSNNPQVDMNAKSQIDLTPLHLASMYNDKMAVETLLQSKKVDVNPIDVNNMTPLHYATLMGNLEVAEPLIADENINMNAKTKFIEWTPLHYAIFFRKIDVVKALLISDKIDINSVAADGVTPLHLATATGLNIVLNLLSKGAFMEQKTKDGFTALHIAALRSEDNIAAIFIGNGANIFAQTSDNSTPMHLAASKGRLTIVSMLIEKGANVNSKNGDGDSPLHLAAIEGHYRVIEYLMSRDADIDSRDNNGLLFFYVLIQNNQLSAIKYLVEHSEFDVNRIDYFREESGEKRKSIMHWSVCDAVAYGKLELVKYFVGSLNKVFCDPLNNAALRGHLDIVKYLVEGKGMNVDGRLDTDALNVDGTFNAVRTPPLFSAVTGNNFEIIKYLVSKYANINIIYHDQNCLLYPILQRDLTMVKFLIKRGADIYFKDKAGKTLLHHCVERQHILAYLVQEKGLNVHARDNDGNTIMHYVAKYDDEPSIIFLCSFGADWSIRNNHNKTPYDLVLDLGKTPVKKCIIPKTTRRNAGVNNISTREFVQPNGKIMLHNQEVLRRIGSSLRKNKFTDASNSGIKGISLPVKNANRWKRSENKLINPIDVNGVLLLLDVLIRKHTKQNYISTEDVAISESGAQVAALNITEKFEKLLNILSKIPAEEHIDLTQVHRDIFKAITSGKQSKISEILCSYVKEFSMQNAQSWEKSVDAYMTTNPVISHSEDGYHNYLPVLISQVCPGSIAVDHANA